MYKVVSFLLLLPFFAFSQIINVETLRKSTDTTGWHGNTSLDFALTKTTGSLLRIGNSTHVQYKLPRHLYLLVGNITFERSAGQDFVNQGSVHFRHNYKIHHWITWENFVQAQYNGIAKINYRGLAGTGPRFKLLGKDKYRFYLGVLAMYDYEVLNENPKKTNENIRSSNYISFTLQPTDNISILSTTYYQPLFRDFADYRFATENSLMIAIVNSLSLKTTYTLTYNSNHAFDVPSTFYKLSTGVTYTFQ